MSNQLLTAFRIKIFFTLVLGLGYPLAMTGICQALFPHRANGSLVTSGGAVVGSELIGQSFTRPEYFHPRPSSAGSGYDPTASGGSNYGPTSAKLLYGSTKTDDKGNEVVDFDGIALRVVHYCTENGMPLESSAPLDQFKDGKGNLDDVKLIKAFNDPKAPLTIRATTPVPADAVTGSASGLDPHISPANAEAQAQRVAATRGVAVELVREAIAGATEPALLGLIGEPRVNVLRLNLGLDERLPLRQKAGQ